MPVCRAVVVWLCLGVGVAFGNSNVQAHEQALAAGKTDVQKLENVYLLHYSARLLTALGQYAAIANQPIQLATEALATTRCQFMLPLVADWQATQNQHAFIDRQLHFQQLLTISQLLVQLQHRLQELRAKHHKLEINLMRKVTAGQDFDAEMKELEQKIAALTANIDTIFANDSTNMILTLKVRDRGKRIPFYQKIVFDYYRNLEAGVIGDELFARILQANNTLYVDLLNSHIAKSIAHLHEAWQHTCQAQAAKPKGFASLLYYFKHKLLVAQVVEALQAHDAKLLVFHDKLKNRYKRQSLPSHYHSSAGSFFGMLGALVIPSLFVPRQHNRITLPVMALAGAAFTWQKVGALQRVRQQLELGAFNALNSYDAYREFADNTSVSKYAFSHVAAIALALVLRKMPTPNVSGILNVDTKMLVKVNVIGSLASLFAIEAKQSNSFNFLKDREFFYNVFSLIMIDAALAYLSSVNLPDETRVAAIAAATLITSVVAHIASGKEINWDRIIYDTTFVSTYSMYKSTYFYTRGSRALISKLNKLNVQGIAKQTGVMSVMAVVSNAMGNVPYSLISRQWIEKKNHYSKDIADLAKKIREEQKTNN
ncbi:MAG: hypothetical protein OYH77_08355 [Pseudomonadota bacterium]|nr:hypothetical protein [Pseudomonadota bacterium]